MSDENAKSSARIEPLYVGYRPLPPRDRSALRIVVPALLIACGAIGAALAIAQRDPGSGVWHADVREYAGTVTLEPYPALLMNGQAYFLVAAGKHGVHDRLRDVANQPARIMGTLIERSGRRLIEVAPDDDAIVRIGDASAEAVATSTSSESHSSSIQPRPISIIAEIVDGKCYLGAMKPGDAKGHKACATLCIEGGLPPLVIELKGLGAQFTCPPTSIQPDEIFPLLRVDGSTALPPEVLAMVAEPVRIAGTLTTVHGLPVIDTTAAQITRAAR